MIELGTIPIKDDTSIIEARNKVRILAQDLKFGSITATRLASMASEFSRRMVTTGQASNIKVGLDTPEGVVGLVLLFTSGQPGAAPVERLKAVFDKVEVSQTADGLHSIKAFEFLQDPKFEPTQEFIARATEVVGRLTREELHAQLEQKVVELEQANIALEEASRHKSQFLANMSHELRTPLNSIIGYTKLVLDGLEGDINEEQREDLQSVYVNSEHLLKLINDLLDISKIEAGKIVLRCETFAMSDLMAEVIPTIERLAREKGLAFRHSVDPNIDYLYADKAKTKQVLINLLGNAVKFTDEGSVKLDLAQTDGDFVFSVTDTGVGIEAEDLETIFDAFEQAGPSQVAGYEGTGLGLAISKQFIAMQGGTIWAESEPGKGSTFTFTLPKKTVTGP